MVPHLEFEELVGQVDSCHGDDRGPVLGHEELEGRQVEQVHSHTESLAFEGHW